MLEIYLSAMKGGENQNMKKGFTLIELLIVIAIIAIIAGAVLVAINPAKRIGEANDSARWAEVNSIGSAIAQYTVDNGGSIPQCNEAEDIPDAATYICEDCEEDSTAGDLTPDIDAYGFDDAIVECDLSELVDDGYLSSIAIDPATDPSVDGLTGYQVEQDILTDAVCVRAATKYGTNDIVVCR